MMFSSTILLVLGPRNAIKPRLLYIYLAFIPIFKSELLFLFFIDFSSLFFLKKILNFFYLIHFLLYLVSYFFLLL